MRKSIILGLIAATLVPSLAAAQTRELRRDRQDVRQETRDVRQAQRYGDRGDVREERHELRGARRELREDRRDYRQDDWRDYRRSNGAAFRQGRYVGPDRNWRYRPVSAGYRFAPAFYSQRYWINDPYRYRLPRAAGVNRYIRYGNDAVLVNPRNGRVVQVYNGFFF